MKNYEIHKENGDLNKAYSLDFINVEYDSYRGIERKELINILVNKIGSKNIAYGSTVTKMKQNNNKVTVSFSNDTIQEFDMIIIADGIHSETRKLLWQPDEYSFYDTHWGGYVAWLENQQLNTYKEYWGASSFMGLYPVKDKVGVFVGGPNEIIKEQGIQKFIKDIKKDINPEHQLLRTALSKLASTENPYYWEFHDCKTNAWNKENVVLLGDSACGFLPTAGVGASMAMDSAAALVDELSRADKQHLSYALKLYVSRQRARVEEAQADSRKLGKLMFVKSKTISAVRDYAIRFYSLKQLVANISNVLEGHK